MPGELIGPRVEARADSCLVKIYSRGQLIKTHPRKPAGGRSTDPAGADQMFRTLKAARLDNSVEAEMRALSRIEVLILDDLALQAMHATETSDFYELIVERHQKTSTIVTSNRDPSEWIAVMSDPLLAQSAVDRLVSTSYELVIEGESYRRRQRPQPAANRTSD